MFKKSVPFLTITIALTAACGSEDETETPPRTTSALYDCPEDTFEQNRPLVGPGIAPGQGLLGERQASYVVHTTQIYARPEKAQAFMEVVGSVIAQLEETPGLVGYALGTDPACGVARTLGVWASEEAMYRFATSGAHLEAMGQFTDLALTGRVTHWNATPEEVEALTFDVARQRIATVDPGYVAPEAP